VLGWVGEWCVGVWYDIFVIKNVLQMLFYERDLMSVMNVYYGMLK